MSRSIMRGLMKNSATTLAFVLIFSAFSTRAWADTVWTLEGVDFSDDATATGSFTINSTFTALTAWNITVSGSTLSPSANAHYDNGDGDSGAFDISSTEVELFITVPGFAQGIILIPTAAMTNAGGTIPLTTGVNGGTDDCNALGACGFATAGSITTSAVPEPSSVLLFASGAGLLGFALYRRRRTFSA